LLQRILLCVPAKILAPDKHVNVYLFWVAVEFKQGEEKQVRAKAQRRKGRCQEIIQDK
jgi:hypothetical protein